MFEFPKKLDGLRILISNDDGVRAPGIKVLERIARTISDDVWTVAPENEQSGAGHSLTLRAPLWLKRVAKQRYAVDGTPTDSVLVGVHKVLADRPPDLVLSGINRGANLGEFVTYSGTVAAALEATLLGLPAMALSLQVNQDKNEVHWSTVEKHAPEIIRTLLRTGWPKRTLLNLNFPNVLPDGVTGVEVTKQADRTMGDTLVEQRHPRGGRYYWIGALPLNDAGRKGTDRAAVAAGRVSITPIGINMTNARAMKPLARAFGGD
jgi:5'-nucleotidase